MPVRRDTALQKFHGCRFFQHRNVSQERDRVNVKHPVILHAHQRGHACIGQPLQCKIAWNAEGCKIIQQPLFVTGLFFGVFQIICSQPGGDRIPRGRTRAALGGYTHRGGRAGSDPVDGKQKFRVKLAQPGVKPHFANQRIEPSPNQGNHFAQTSTMRHHPVSPAAMALLETVRITRCEFLARSLLFPCDGNLRLSPCAGKKHLPAWRALR